MSTRFSLPPLPLAAYRFTLAPTEPMPLPLHKGAVLRGGFGITFKRLVCAERDPLACTPCRLGNACPYGYVFETSPPDDTEVLRGLSDVPTPFVFDPPDDGRTRYEPGDALRFGLVLAGRGIQYLPYFLVVFEELGRAGLGPQRARFEVRRVEAVDPLGGGVTAIYGDGGPLRADGAHLVQPADIERHAAALPADRADLAFLTPTRLKHQDRYAVQPDFHVLVRALLRRVSALAYFHGGRRWEADFGGLIAAATEVRTAASDVRWEEATRFSSRQRQDQSLGGLVGTVAYAGDLGPFRPLLVVGQLVHVGKGAVFGNGRYVVGDAARNA